MALQRLQRRQFLQGMLATGALGTMGSLAQSPSTNSASSGWALLGTQTGEGIYRARWDRESGQLGTPELAVATPRPTYLTAHPTLPVLYCGNELDDPNQASISAFTLDRSRAALTPLGKQPTHGADPCFVSVDRTGQLLFAANYGGGSLATFTLDARGAPAPASLFACDHNGVCGTPGPVHDRQDGPHLHCAVLSPDNHFVLACDLGDDAILAFPLHPGQTPPVGPPQRLPARIGSGPRHLAFHPNGRWLYCIHELDSTVDLYTWHSDGAVANAQLVPGVLVKLALTSTAPAPSGTTPNTAAEIAISRNGHFLYTCTRGVNILTVFRIDETTGKLDALQELPCGGRIPRFFALDPTERWLLCTNQDSNNISLFARNAETGALSPHGSVNLPSPMCVLWL